MDKVKAAGSSMWRALDGWKTILGVLITLGFSIYDHATGHKTSDVVGVLLTLIGWGDLPLDGSTMGSAVGAGVILVGFVHKLAKANAQRKAGAPLTELLSDEGYVAKVVEDIQKKARE